MPNPDERPAPTRREISDLKRLAAGIVRVQGNRFIKDLLRTNSIRVRGTKDQFESDLNAAIENGSLRMDHVSAWLQSVEGWGNQHVYLYALPPEISQSLTPSQIERQVRTARLQKFWNRESTMSFPDQPELASISFTDNVLRLIWHESAPGWVPEPEKNYQQEEGLDLYEYRAYRRVERRAVTRFEARVEEGIAALFIPNPIMEEEHQAAKVEAERVIALLMDKQMLENSMIQIADVSKNLDQRNIPNNAAVSTQIKTQKSRLSSGGAYVEFASNSSGQAYWEEPAVENVRKAVRDGQLQAFHGGEGIFIFQQAVPGLSQSFRVQLYGQQNRIRLWAQMEASEVWTILRILMKYK